MNVFRSKLYSAISGVPNEKYCLIILDNIQMFIVHAGDVNIALGRPTSQTSLYAQGHANKAVDGNADTHYFRGR